MQHTYFLGVKLTPPVKAAFDRIVKGRTAKCPLLPPSQSDVIRQMIVEEDAHTSSKDTCCQQCHQAIPVGEGKILT